MALPELIAALEKEADEEVAGLLADARSQAESILAAAGAEASRRRDEALGAERSRLAREEETAAAAATLDARSEELAARERLLVRAAAAIRSAAFEAEASLTPAAIGRLVEEGCRYLPGGVTLRCPAVLLAVAGEADLGAGIAVEAAEGGEGLALVAGPWRVELGLASLVEGRWLALAPRLLRELEGSNEAQAP